MKLRQRELPALQNDLTRQMREMWQQGHLCDVTLKSCDGQTHRGHRIVLSAASNALKALLGETFSEGQQIQQGQPIEIGASDEVVRALLDHIYGGEPEITPASATELLRLAGAYELPKLCAEIELELRDSMDAAKALQLLQQIHSFGQTDLREACEVEIARDFENCVQLSSFTKLSSSQLARILARDDLWVTQEEVVVQGLFNWMKTSKKRRSHLGMLLQLIDLPSLSTQNLKRLRSFAQSMGEDGFELQYSADEALRSQLKAKAQRTEGFHRPPGKRRCLQHWSTEQRSFSRSYIRGRWVAGDWGTRFGSIPLSWNTVCFHQDYFYIADGGLTRWKPHESRGRGLIANCVHGITISPQGQIYLVDKYNGELRVYDSNTPELAPPRFVAKIDDGIDLFHCSCSPSGVLYTSGTTDYETGQVKRLEGSNLVPLSVDLPSDFVPHFIFAARDEVLYIAGIDDCLDVSELWVFLRVDPGQSEPVELGRMETEVVSGLFVTDSGQIYVADGKACQIVVFNPGDTRPVKVVGTHEPPVDLLVQNECLYVLLISGRVYEYAFPPALEFE